MCVFSCPRFVGSKELQQSMVVATGLGGGAPRIVVHYYQLPGFPCYSETSATVYACWNLKQVTCHPMSKILDHMDEGRQCSRKWHSHAYSSVDNAAAFAKSSHLSLYIYIYIYMGVSLLNALYTFYIIHPTEWQKPRPTSWVCICVYMQSSKIGPKALLKRIAWASPNWSKLAPIWGQVGAKLGASWSQVGAKVSQVGATLMPSWAKLAPSWGQV